MKKQLFVFTLFCFILLLSSSLFASSRSVEIAKYNWDHPYTAEDDAEQYIGNVEVVSLHTNVSAEEQYGNAQVSSYAYIWDSIDLLVDCYANQNTNTDADYLTLSNYSGANETYFLRVEIETELEEETDPIFMSAHAYAAINW